MKRLHAARRNVLAQFPEAFCWKEFTVSDYEVKDKPGGGLIGWGPTALSAWEHAERSLNG